MGVLVIPKLGKVINVSKCYKISVVKNKDVLLLKFFYENDDYDVVQTNIPAEYMKEVEFYLGRLVVSSDVVYLKSVDENVRLRRQEDGSHS